MIRPGVKGCVIAVAHSGDIVLAPPGLRALEAALNPSARGAQP